MRTRPGEQPATGEVPIGASPSAAAASAAGSGRNCDGQVQRRTVRVLMAAQVFSAVAVTLGLTVGAVAAVELSGSDAVGGAVLTATAIGAAIASAWVARIADAAGRRPSLTIGYGLAALGSVIATVGIWAEWWPILIAGMVAFGSGLSTGLAARFAAADLAEPEYRARAVGTVLWAGTVGAVAGPTLAGPVERLSERTAVPGLAGVFLLCSVLYAVAAVIVSLFLRPDPLVRARERAGQAVSAVRSGGWALVWSNPTARFALIGIAMLHLGMISVMSMSPVHLHHGGASLDVIGLVISVHVIGMYMFSPVFGMLADRIGRAPTLLGGVVISISGALVSAASDSNDSALLAVGLLLIGLGWSAGLVAGSALLVESMAPADRPRAQGTSDVTMNGAGALGGLFAGSLVALGSFAVLGALTAALLVPFLLLGLRSARVGPAPVS